MSEPAPAEGDPFAVMRSRQFVAILVLAAVVGVIASAAAWGFLELIAQIKDWVYDDLPDALGFDGIPLWWPVPILAIAGVVTAFAIVRLPGTGGHVPAGGLNPAPTQPVELPGVILAALAAIGLGVVLGPEAPLIALGGGLGFFVVQRLRADAPPELGTVIAAAGTFAGISFLFGSPMIAAVLLIEATGIGGQRLPLVLLPGLVAAGIGSLLSTGLNSWTGVDTSDISISAIQLPDYARPEVVDFLWTVPLALVIALVTWLCFRLGREAARITPSRPFFWIPLAGIVVAGLAAAFAALTDKGVEQVLFSGQDELAPLVAHADSWSVGALIAVIAFKGIGYGVSLGSFRGGPVFPGLFLGAAAGLIFTELGFSMTPAVAVGLGAGTAAVLRLPLSAVVLATVLTAGSGLGAGPLIIVGVAVAYLTMLWLPRLPDLPKPAGSV